MCGACRAAGLAYDLRSMSQFVPPRSHVISRRGFAAGLGLAAFAGPVARASGASTFRIGCLPFGTVQWEMSTLVGRGLDTAEGIKVEMVPLAGSDAARIAFLSGSVDAIANDLLFAARLRADGKSVLFMPHSTTEGALMAPAATPIKTFADLKGKALGVSGGPLDKSWLVLRAAAQKAAGLDLRRDARPVYGAPPLLAAKVESGELACGLLYWSQAARLEAKGFRRVFGVEDLLLDLGAKPKVAIVGYLFKRDADPHTLAAFARAVRATERVLATDAAAWATLRPQMSAPDDATFAALRDAYVRGIPRKPRAQEIADAQALFAILARLGGSELVGPNAALPDDLYVDQTVYG